VAEALAVSQEGRLGGSEPRAHRETDLLNAVALPHTGESGGFRVALLVSKQARVAQESCLGLSGRCARCR
jgi:hypothetical protein